MSWLLYLALALPAQTNRIILGGDVMLSRYVWQAAEARKDPAWPVRNIAADFAAADIAFVNFESAFIDRPPYFQDRMIFRTNPVMVEALKAAGIDVVSTANNHCRDAGARGVEFTLDLLSENGIAAAGTARNPADLGNGAIVERKGVRFGFLAYTFDQRNGNYRDDDARIAMLDVDAMRQHVQAMRSRAHVIIVSMHAGQEYVTRPNPRQIEFARAAIDAGASVVVGHHPHILQPVETYKGGLILYSLGNLVFDQADKPGPPQGAIAELTFTGNRITGFLLRPVRIRQSVTTLLDPIDPPQLRPSTSKPSVARAPQPR